jgi:methylated-DNA-[protein]-cysteine S-methyltransferase
VEWTETRKSWEISGFEQPFEGCEAIAGHFDKALEAFFEGNFDLIDAISVDCSGWTPFFEKVYHHCRAIPAGSTVSYGELAALAGSPKAARAVGQAMATNRLPLVIPCHRVLAAGGKLGGYGGPGGTKTKTWLLESEQTWVRKLKTQ